MLPAFSALACYYENSPHLNLIFQLIETIAFDYPPQTQKLLESLQNDYPESDLAKKAKSIQTKMDKYFAALHALPRVKEICPSRSEELFFRKEKHKNMSRQLQAAHKKSIFNQIASSIPLKAGKAFFSYRKNLPDNPTPLTTHETVFSLPRSILIDPVQYELSRLVFRLQTKGEL